uniref:hypothetical protein n=1 Tax=Nonomuraea pusilla TaxID=46177 RepID=UPI0006E269A1
MAAVEQQDLVVVDLGHDRRDELLPAEMPGQARLQPITGLGQGGLVVWRTTSGVFAMFLYQSARGPKPEAAT